MTLLAESHSRMLLHIGQLEFFDATLIPRRIYLVSAFQVLENPVSGAYLNYFVVKFNRMRRVFSS